jgi:hypothetical protein
MDGADLDRPAYGYLDDDGALMAGEVEEDQSLSDDSVDKEQDYPYLNPPAYGYPDDGEERLLGISTPAPARRCALTYPSSIQCVSAWYAYM